MKKGLILLITILVVATFLRVYQLDKVPPSLFGDEVDVGYQAYSLLKTGQDMMGNSWPILVRSLSEYRAPLFIYSDVPFIAIFGLNEWGVRLAAVFWGVLGILGMYLLAGKMFNQRIALLAAGFLSISPWHIQYSRAGFEVAMLLTFMIFATFFFLKGLEKKYYLFFSAILFSLTPYIYSTAVVFMPLLLLILILISRIKVSKQNLIALIFFIVILIPFGLQTISGAAGDRFNLISIFGNQKLQDKVILLQQREPTILGKIFHNKPAVYLQNFTTNYMRAFSPEFLFLQGDPNSRHSAHEMGQMYFFEAILLLLAFWIIFKKPLDKEKKIILGWLIIAPIPASLTYDGGFHATRNFLMLVPLMVIISIGADLLVENFNKKALKKVSLLLTILALFNFAFYLHRYFIDYPYESWRAWHFGFKQSMQYVSNNPNYEKFFINNTYEPSLVRFLFWTKYNPDKFHKEFHGDNYNGFSLENKYFFGKINGPFEEILDSKSLYIASARDDITNPETLNDKRVNLLETIYSPSFEPVFYLITGTK